MLLVIILLSIFLFIRYMPRLQKDMYFEYGEYCADSYISVEIPTKGSAIKATTRLHKMLGDDRIEIKRYVPNSFQRKALQQRKAMQQMKSREIYKISRSVRFIVCLKTIELIKLIGIKGDLYNDNQK